MQLSKVFVVVTMLSFLALPLFEGEQQQEAEPEKPEELNIIALDLDAQQFGPAVAFILSGFTALVTLIHLKPLREKN